MSFDSLLNTTCTLQTNTPTQDSAGQWIDSWAATITGIPCRIEPYSGGLTRTPREVYDKATHIIYIRKPATALTTYRQRIVCGGVNYTILLVQELFGAAIADHIELILERVL